MRGRLNAGETVAGKLSRSSFDSAVGRAQKNDSLRKHPADKQYELILNFLRAFHSEMEDKSQLSKRHYFGAIFEIFDEVVRKAKKEHSSVKLAALQAVVGRFSDIAESDYSGPARRQRLVEAMRSRLNSDTSIDQDDI